MRRPSLSPAVARAACMIIAALAAAAAPVAAAAAEAAAAKPVRATAQGLGPLQLGASLIDAARATVVLDPAAAMIGPGCDERDQISVVLEVAGQPMSVMAMADAEGHIEEILATPAGSAGIVVENAASCQAYGRDFAARFENVLGAAQAWPALQMPVTREFHFSFAGGARIVSRWFAGGRTCDLLLQYGGRNAPPQ